MSHLSQSTWIPFQGLSMWPLLRAGDKILVQPTSQLPLQLGQILVFHDKDELVAHRLILKTSTSLYFKGDFSPKSLSTKCESHIWGVVIGRNRQGIISRWPQGKHLLQSLFLSFSKNALNKLTMKRRVCLFFLLTVDEVIFYTKKFINQLNRQQKEERMHGSGY